MTQCASQAHRPADGDGFASSPSRAWLSHQAIINYRRTPAELSNQKCATPLGVPFVTGTRSARRAVCSLCKSSRGEHFGGAYPDSEKFRGFPRTKQLTNTAFVGHITKANDERAFARLAVVSPPKDCHARAVYAQSVQSPASNTKRPLPQTQPSCDQNLVKIHVNGFRHNVQASSPGICRLVLKGKFAIGLSEATCDNALAAVSKEMTAGLRRSLLINCNGFSQTWLGAESGGRQ